MYEKIYNTDGAAWVTHLQQALDSSYPGEAAIINSGPRSKSITIWWRYQQPGPAAPAIIAEFR